MEQSQEYREFIAGYPSLSAIGNTPMVRLDLPLDTGEAAVHAKYEHLNPGGSIKDRPVLRMLVKAVLSGELTKERVILDATSGNAGIAYAMIGAALGYRVKLVMPENASEERKRRLLAHGAEIHFTDPMLGTTRRYARCGGCTKGTRSGTSTATSTATRTIRWPTTRRQPRRSCDRRRT